MRTSRIVLMAAALMATQYAGAAEQTQTFESAQIKSMEITNGAGDVSIDVSRGPTTVTHRKVKSNAKCEFSAEVVGSVLVIKAINKTDAERADCKVNVSVSGPKNVAIKIKNGSGDIKIKDTYGKVEYKVGSGDVNIGAEVTELRGTAGSGDLSAEGLSGDADVQSGSGEINLTYKTCPVKGKIDISTGGGNATVKLPRDSTVFATLKAGSGELKNDFGNSPEAKLKISMKSGSGNLTIKGK